MKTTHKLAAFLCFAMYFLTGAACVILGSSVPQLSQAYGFTVGKVAMLGTAYALGRIATVLISGHLVEKLGALKVLFGGVLLIAIFLVGVPMWQTYYAGMIFAIIGGIGMGTQDATTPVLLSAAFKHNYEGSLTFGQGLFGVGTTVAPFLIGLFLKNKLPFTFSYFTLAGFAIIMLVVIPFTHLNKKDNSGHAPEHIVPLLTKNIILAYIGIFVFIFAFSALSSVFSYYTTAFAESIGISSANAQFVFTTYNVGCVIGGFVFTLVLRYLKPQTVLTMNVALAFIGLGGSLMINSVQGYYVGFFLSGIFLGSLFSVIVGIATRIGYKRMSMASSLVATASAAGDFITPAATGFLVDKLGISFSFKFALVMLGVCILFAALIKLDTYEKENSVSAEKRG